MKAWLWETWSRQSALKSAGLHKLSLFRAVGSATLMLAAGVAQAGLWDGETYAGITAHNSLLGANLTLGGDAAAYSLVVGSYMDIRDEQFAYLARYQRYLDGNGGSGYTFGFTYGDLKADQLKGVHFFRKGLAGELGYQWVTPYTRKSLTAGVGFVESMKLNYTVDSDGTPVPREARHDAEPMLMLSYTLSYRL